VGGWNVGKFENLCKELEEREMDIFCLAETHLRERVSMNCEKYTSIGKGRSKQRRKGGGVAILYRNDKDIRVQEIDVGETAKSEDILAMKIETMKNQEKEIMIVMVVYMSTESTKAQQENPEKYDIISNKCEKFENEKSIVLGDMNGHMGLIGEEINRNRKLLIEFANEYNLEILNETIAEGKITWSARGQESAIDYVLVNEAMRKMTVKMVVDETKDWDITTDHNVICVTLQIGSEKKDTRLKMKRKWKLRDADWNSFQVDVSEMNWTTSKTSISEISEEFTDKVNKIGSKCINWTVARRRPAKSWWTREINEARKVQKDLNKGD
jgi:hypothetical protein